MNTCLRQLCIASYLHNSPGRTRTTLPKGCCHPKRTDEAISHCADQNARTIVATTMQRAQEKTAGMTHTNLEHNQRPHPLHPTFRRSVVLTARAGNLQLAWPIHHPRTGCVMHAETITPHQSCRQADRRTWEHSAGKAVAVHKHLSLSQCRLGLLQ